MTFRSILSLGALGVLLFATSTLADETAERCAEAWKRYESAEVPAAMPGTETVLMFKYRFCPTQLTVKPGTTVRFVNVDKRTSHSVWFKDKGDEESDRLFPEELWQMTLETPGTYPYLCGPHWEQEGMRGALTVAE